VIIEHFVKEIPDGQRLKSSDLSFKIKWQGFGDRWNTIEPFGNVRLNDKVHEYLRTHGLKRFIPRNLTRDVDIVDRTVTWSLPLSNMEKKEEEVLYWRKNKIQNQSRDGSLRQDFWTSYSKRQRERE
jgi:hypothetical protein